MRDFEKGFTKNFEKELQKAYIEKWWECFVVFQLCVFRKKEKTLYEGDHSPANGFNDGEGGNP